MPRDTATAVDMTVLVSWLPEPLKSLSSAIESWLARHPPSPYVTAPLPPTLRQTCSSSSLTALRNLKPEILGDMIDEVFPAGLSPWSLGVIQLHEACGLPYDRKVTSNPHHARLDFQGHF